MKPHPEMIEGPQASDRFMKALKAVVAAPKNCRSKSIHKTKVKTQEAAR